eukprot:TRINITY_DN6120_c0_g1_i1.p1 TRINITY_DN6120_c0_g1~~TRINITY_DN6120_c0_g1_i1.p1  ORF type:complete len:239 (-),score=62.03 TRINITY_DN6120_c0_g1_i1:98-814(-)
MKIEVVRMGPGMISQRQMVCDQCKGEGEVIPKDDRCEKCKGNKVVPESKIISVDIEKGMRWGQSISLYGESDQAPDHQTGDLVLVLQPKDDVTETYQRKGDDLYLTHTVPLVEALTGVRFVAKHLDGSDILLHTDNVTSPGELLKVNHRGMPIHGKVDTFGDLYVQINVTFPESLSDKQKKLLHETFNHKPKSDEKHNEKHHLRKIKPGEGPKKEGRNGPRQNDDEGQGGQRVECAQQ